MFSPGVFVLQNGLLRYYFTHAQSCDNVRVHSATEWTAITFVFIVLRNGLRRYIPYACPKL